MNVEQLEHELNHRKGAIVMVVRPGYGTQSESWVGTLTITNRDYPMIFQVHSERGATIFRGDDVISVEPSRSAEADCVVRLKGPNDYMRQTVTA